MSDNKIRRDSSEAVDTGHALRAEDTRSVVSVDPMYRLWVNENHTVAIRLWEDDTLEVMTRESSDYDWGRATVLREEKVT